VVGSGPGGLQVSYCLGRLGVEHAVISADDGPGGMFRRWPLFQRLLSWTKRYAPAPRRTAAFERYDWNSLLADEPEHRSLQVEFMDGSSSFPSRPEMERRISAFAEQTGIRVRYGCRWTATRREDGPAGERWVLETTDGEYRARYLVIAVGVAEPYTPEFPGAELTAHYADTRPVESYAGRRVFIIGKQNSGFELASGLLGWASRIVLSSPSPARLSVNTRSLVGVRARYVQPYEDHVLGGGVTVLDAALESVERDGDSFLVRLRTTGSGDELRIPADEVIAATGFVCPLLDLPQLGVATFGQSRLPAQTPFWESTSLPGLFFAGTISQGSVGLKKHGLPANSGAVHGARYNARVLSRWIAQRLFDVSLPTNPLERGSLVEFCLGEIAGCPELWHQKAYLARVVTVDALGIHDAGIQPLAHELDLDGPDALILTLEANGSGSIYPVVYLRRAGSVEEHVLDPDPLLSYETERYRRQLSELADRIVPAGSTLRAG
jgi:thioredoxin reductase